MTQEGLMMGESSSNLSLWEKLEKLPGHLQAALASVFIPLTTVLLAWLMSALFPVALFVMILLGVPLGLFALGFAIVSVVGGFQHRMPRALLLGLIGFVLSGLLSSYCINSLLHFFGGLGGC
jgi:hypothetical protein